MPLVAAWKNQLVEKVQEQGGLFCDSVTTQSTFAVFKTHFGHTFTIRTSGIKRYGENGKNLYQTCKHFALNSKSVIRWLTDIRALNVFVDMMPTNHALVRVLFQVFLAFCHSTLL